MYGSISKLVLGGGAATLLAVGAAVSGAPAAFAAATPSTATVQPAAAGKHDHRQDRRQIEEAVFVSEADVLGITPDQLRQDLKAGRSVSDLAEAKGLSKEAFAQALAADLKPRLDQLVDAGAISRAQADRTVDRISKGHIPFWERHRGKHQ